MAKYNRNSGKAWAPKDVSRLKSLAKQNTPTRVIGLKLGRTPKADEGVRYLHGSVIL